MLASADALEGAMSRWKRVALAHAAAAAWVVAGGSHAAVVTAELAPVGPLWSMSLRIVNDGSPPEIGHFTVFFDASLFSNLTVMASPDGWDSLAVAPDLALASPGFFDALALPATAPLGLGQSLGGFALQFAYSGVGAPAALPFDIVNDNYDVLFTGLTSAVPEPGSAWMGLLGGALLLARRRRQARPGSTPFVHAGA